MAYKHSAPDGADLIRYGVGLGTGIGTCSEGMTLLGAGLSGEVCR